MPRYFIGVAVMEPEKGMIDELRQRIEQSFDVHAALRVPPHITLFHPFEMQDENALITGLMKSVRARLPFVVSMDGYASFDDKVWFIDPNQDPNLFSLKNEIAGVLSEEFGITEQTPWSEPHFHITLAYKDVLPAVHPRIGEFLKNESLPLKRMTVSHVSLFRALDGGGWELAKNVPFGRS